MTKGSLKHYGTPRHSGRYPYGSGEDPEQHGEKTFLGQVKKLQRQGMSEVAIARAMGMTTSELRKKKSNEKAAERADQIAQVKRLKEKGMSNVAIGERMGLNESSVRALLDPVREEGANETKVVANVLRENVDRKKYIDIGTGVEVHLGVTRTKFNNAVQLLEDEGYQTFNQFRVPQAGMPGKYTTMKVLAQPGTTFSQLFKERDQIRMITDYSDDGTRTDFGLKPPVSVKRDRIAIRYAEEGGSDKDGTIELRRGVEDISLGNLHYAQVRVAVDGTHYMKGMAMYGNDIPEGKDIVYNTNKKKGTPDADVFKPMKLNQPQNPFGAVIDKQPMYKDRDGKEHQSPLNIVNEEGSWEEWKHSISSQVLSKQNPALAKKQLALAYDLKKEEFDEIMSLTNPVIRERLLTSFGDDCDSAAVHLKAAALPRQSSHVILPVPSMKPTEIYAPNFENGETVVLIRHPHGGIFEIPSLTVNNKNPQAKDVIGNARDAVGIHPKVAEQLSGADFDGDSVLVIPNKHGEIRTASPLKELKGFNPKKEYPQYEGMKVMDERTKQIEMGKASNLITDMTIRGASDAEIARAVKHSMVVIDAVKHKLDWQRSYQENGIAQLKADYQDGGGAATLISRAKSEVRIPVRKQVRYVDPKTGKKYPFNPITGEKVYEDVGGKRGSYVKTVPVKRSGFRVDPLTGAKIYNESKAKVMTRTESVSKMALETDARNLSSGTRMENIYADHANALKALANRARIEVTRVEPLVYSPTAREVYKEEVRSLKAKLNNALRAKPLERQAQLVTNTKVRALQKSNPAMEKDELKKIKGQILTETRRRINPDPKERIPITDREWEAIQAGAVTNSFLKQIALNTDLDKLKERAMPRRTTVLSPARIARAQDMRSRGYTNSEIASAIGVSVSVLNKAMQ